MPIYSATRTGGAQFDGAAAASGLFNPGANTGGNAIQVRINSIVFSTGGAITDWTLNLVDPSDGQVIELLTDTTTDLATGGPQGFMILPTNSGGQPWRMTFITTGLAAAGTLKIDYDFSDTEG